MSCREETCGPFPSACLMQKPVETVWSISPPEARLSPQTQTGTPYTCCCCHLTVLAATSERHCAFVPLITDNAYEEHSTGHDQVHTVSVTLFNVLEITLFIPTTSTHHFAN